MLHVRYQVTADISYLLISGSLVGEVIYKYKKQQEAESRQQREEVLVFTLLYTHHPVMTEVWMGYTLLNRMSP